MAHFAQIDENGTVTQVISLNDLDAAGAAPHESEPRGQAFIADVLGLAGEWRQTAPDGTFRLRFAGIGYTYDPMRDAFVAPRPYPSWTIGDDDDWQPPTPMPSEGGPWRWDEATLSWVEVTA